MDQIIDVFVTCVWLSAH